jgi:hypothetical protein
MVIEPDAGAVAIVALIAAFTIVIGVMQVGFALDLRNVGLDVRSRISRIFAGRPEMATDTDRRSRCLFEESSARALNVQAPGGDVPRGGGAGS